MTHEIFIVYLFLVKKTENKTKHDHKAECSFAPLVTFETQIQWWHLTKLSPAIAWSEEELHYKGENSILSCCEIDLFKMYLFYFFFRKCI